MKNKWIDYEMKSNRNKNEYGKEKVENWNKLLNNDAYFDQLLITRRYSFE